MKHLIITLCISIFILSCGKAGGRRTEKDGPKQPEFKPFSELSSTEILNILKPYYFVDSSISIDGEIQELEKCEFERYNFQENYIISAKIYEGCSLEQIAIQYQVFKLDEQATVNFIENGESIFYELFLINSGFLYLKSTLNEKEVVWELKLEKK